MTLQRDFDRCTGDDCVKRYECNRYVDRHNGAMPAVKALCSRGAPVEFFIPVKKK